MKVKGISLEQLEECARQAGGMRLENVRTSGRYVFFVLRPTQDGERQKWQKRGHNDRRVNAICFHGHKRFMSNVFVLNPNAVIRTAENNYLGIDDFRVKAERLAHKNIGSMMNPRSWDEACNGHDEHGVRLVTMRLDGSETKVYRLKQSDMRRCRFAILLPSHYRDDGTCRCNDAEHREMKEWGYRWSQREHRWTA
jgi:hypothetical protein